MDERHRTEAFLRELRMDPETFNSFVNVASHHVYHICDPIGKISQCKLGSRAEQFLTCLGKFERNLSRNRLDIDVIENGLLQSSQQQDVCALDFPYSWHASQPPDICCAELGKNWFADTASHGEAGLSDAGY